MAQLEYINILGHVKAGVNLSRTVGHGGANMRDDVALIQALFGYIADGLNAQEWLGLDVNMNIPEITGKLDDDTTLAILRFQISQGSGVLNGGENANGRIDPASYRGRVIRNPTGPLMAITRLHILALASAIGSNPRLRDRQWSTWNAANDRFLEEPRVLCRKQG